MVDLYRRRIARTVIELAKDDPDLVISVIAELEATGQIEKGDLDYLKRIAKKWRGIAQRNVKPR